MGKLLVDDTLLVSYADGELDESTAQAVAQAMAEDPVVRERAEMFAASSRLLREALSSPDMTVVPEGLQARVMKLTRLSRWQRVRGWALPMAAAAAGLIIGATHFNLPFAEGEKAEVVNLHEILREVSEYHAAFQTDDGHLAGMPGSRKPEIEAWLSQRLDYPLSVPDLSAMGLRFEEARLFIVEGAPVAQLMYSDGSGKRIALCVGNNAAQQAEALQSLSAQGVKVIGETSAKHVFIVAGPDNDPRVDRLGAVLQSVMKRV